MTVAARSQAGQEARPFSADQQPAPWHPAALQVTDATYFVDWNITASGYSDTQGSKCSKLTTRKITISGDAVHHYSAQEGPITIPMNLVITDDRYEAVRCEDSGYDEWTSIADPSRYTGGPDPFWSGYAVFVPYQAPDGTWSMANPFVDWTFVASGEVIRYYDYQTDLEWYDGDESGSSSRTEEWEHYADILRALKDMPLMGDDTGTVFRLTTAYTVETYDFPLTVHFDATVSGASCRDLGSPIDIANPGLKFVDLNLQAENTTPDREATVQARVTCQGIPVINLNLALVAPQVRPHLAVIDGWEGMEGDGPGVGDAVDWRVALAGTDPLALDVLTAHLMGFDPGRVGYLRYCGELGLGVGELGQIDAVGDIAPGEARRSFVPSPTHEQQLGWDLDGVEAYLGNLAKV